MINKKYYQLIDKIKADIAKNGVASDLIVSDLQALRILVVSENQPLLAKVIRLTFQHLEANKSFQIAIPDDEPFEDENGEEIAREEATIIEAESLDYLLSNMTDISNKMNVTDIRGFVASLKELVA